MINAVFKIIKAFKDQEESNYPMPEPYKAYDRVKKAFIIDVLYITASPSEQKKLDVIYKTLNISDINNYIYELLNEINMQKGNISTNVLNKLKNAHNRRTDTEALSLALNAVHHSGSAMIDYVGLFDFKELDALSNISESEIKKYKEQWGV